MKNGLSKDAMDAIKGPARESDQNFDVNQLGLSYFDRTATEYFQKIQRTKGSHSGISKTKRIQPEPFSCSGAKNLRLLRESG